MSDITDRAERLLAGITPGPWDADKARDGYMSITSPNGPVVWATGQPGSGANIFDRDAAFIAAAPTLVADLLAEVKRLEEWKHLHSADLRSEMAVTEELRDARDAAEAEVKRLTPREITTDAEVSMLPPGTILRDASGHAWYRGEGSWVGGGDGPAYDPVFSPGNLPFPATVLYLPEGGE